MVITKKQAKGLDYKPTTLRTGDFNSGVDDGNSLAAGNIAEIATCQIGTDGKANSLLAFILGQKASPFDQSPKGRPFFDLYDSSAAGDIDDETQVKFVNRAEGDRDGKDLTGWLDIDMLRNTTATEREQIPPQEPGLLEDSVLAIHIRNESTSVTPDFDNASTKIRVPGAGGKN